MLEKFSFIQATTNLTFAQNALQILQILQITAIPLLRYTYLKIRLALPLSFGFVNIVA